MQEMPATPVNLYVDRLMPNAPNTAEEVWNATQEHPKIFAEAARRVGLTGSEYGEFQQALLDGKALYIRLPAHVDAMSGIHNGHPYAIKSVTVPAKTLGWKVALEDGTIVYVPQVCGNISIVRGPVVAHAAKRPAQVAQRPHAVVTQGSYAGPSTPVTFQPPADSSSAYVPSSGPVSSTPAYSQPVYSQPVYSQPVYSAPAYVPPAASGGSVLPFLIPIIAFVGSTVGAVSSPPTTIVPPCSGGSNLLGVCQAGR
jgi:hypothetical protein